MTPSQSKIRAAVGLPAAAVTTEALARGDASRCAAAPIEWPWQAHAHALRMPERQLQHEWVLALAASAGAATLRCFGAAATNGAALGWQATKAAGLFCRIILELWLQNTHRVRMVELEVTPTARSGLRAVLTTLDEDYNSTS